MFEGFFPDQEFLVKTTTILKDQIENRSSESCIDHVIKRCLEKMRQCESFYDNQRNNTLDAASFQKILQLLRELEQNSVDLWKEVFICDIFDPHGEALLHKEIADAKVSLDREELNLLLRPLIPHYGQKERLAILEMALACKTKKLILKNPVVRTFLKDHAAQYFFIENSWAQTKILTSEDFKQRLKELMTLPEKEIKKQIEELTTDWHAKQKEIIKQRNINTRLQRVIYLFQQLMFLRDERKKYVLLNNHWYDVLYQRISEITGVSFEEWSLAKVSDLKEGRTAEEYEKIFASRKEIIMKLSSGQEIWTVDPQHGKLFYDLLSKEFIHKGESITGTPACQGIAQGIVKIVMGETHFGKFEDGNILVAPMTRPEYVPLMKKAAAIITDEGGITCHAAVIARELNVPCIIGTQVATKVLKDGMQVEVDATKGIITVIQ
ncbi:hypothetical protein HYW21_05170 [Candidatus Woesearchaeota archaeon]|nr:hypothetical protein [Candidatus Woesearchaeota archaeon]